MQISGYVKEIYEGTTKWGKPWWSVTLDTGVKITTREPKLMKDTEEKDIEVGKEYTFTYESDGTYTNITAPSVPVISVDSETTSSDSTTAPPVDEPPLPKAGGYSKYGYKETEADYRARQLAIRKAVALKGAIRYVASVLGGTGTTKDVISYAREFEGDYLE